MTTKLIVGKIILFLFCFLATQILSKEIEFELEIPYPSGIYIDKVEDPLTGEIYRFGRLRLSTVKVRPPWEGIFVIEDVLNITEASTLINKAESHAQLYGWSKGRHVDYHIRPTKDLSLSSFLSEIELQQLKARFNEKLFPRYKKQYTIRPTLLRIEDLFITKYESGSKENALAPHIDKNPWSFVIALNDNFDGGGTYFVRQQRVWKLPTGAAVIFHGYQMHGAYKINNGIRYIIAGFCEYGNNTDAQFMAQYDPIYDGYAAQAGFRTGDLIIGIEKCEFQTKESLDDDNNNNQNNDNGKCTIEGKEEVLISRTMVPITLQTTDEEWTSFTQSCEQIASENNIKMKVRRFVQDG
jgi:hypothetical protein